MEPPNHAETLPPPPIAGPLRAGSWAAAIALALCASCLAPPAEPQPLQLPELASEGRLFAGSTLRGTPTGAEELAADPARALRVRVSIVALEELPRSDWTPLATRSRFVADLRNPDPLVGTTQHLVGARFAEGDEAARTLADWFTGGAGRAALVGELDETLPFGATATLGIAGAERVEDPLDTLDEFPDGPAVQKQFQVFVGNGQGGVGVAFVIEDVQPGWWRPVEDEEDQGLAAALLAAGGIESSVVPPDPPGAEPSTGAVAPPPQDPIAETAPESNASIQGERRVLRRELVLLDAAPTPATGPLIVLVPSMFRRGEARAFACAIEVSAPALKPSQLAAFEERIAELRAAGEASAAAEPFSDSQLTLLRRTSAVEALRSDATRRAALLFYAQGLGTPLVDDLALASPEELLEEYADTLLSTIQDLEKEALEELLVDDVRLAWRFESTAYRMLAGRASREALEPELEALLLRHAGEAGRFPTSLEDAVAASTSVADLERRFAEENRIFLEDSSPSARVRGYDWLELRGLQPAGFDPLADRATRRAALRAVEEAAAAETPEEDGDDR